MRNALHIVFALILAALPAMASADIFEWTDDAGVTHYTNLKADVPTEQTARVVVDEQVWHPQPDIPLPDVKAEPVPQPPPQTGDEAARAYIAGLESGLTNSAGTGSNVYITGPLAVTVAPPPVSYSSYAVPAYDWLPAYYTFVATPVSGRHPGPGRGRRFGPAFRGRLPFSGVVSGPAGPPPIGAAGRPPIGAAGRPPLGAAGRPPVAVSGGHFRP
jgi:hypothetical protein